MYIYIHIYMHANKISCMCMDDKTDNIRAHIDI